MIKITQILKDLKGLSYSIGENQNCPFHNSKSKNSFTINSEDNGFYCFSSNCVAHTGNGKNNVFRLISLTNNCNLNEAKRIFFDKYYPDQNISEEKKEEYKKITSEKKIVFDILKIASEHYQSNLDTETIGKKTIREFIKNKRNFNDQTVDSMQIGYSKSFRFIGEDPLFKLLKNKYSSEEILLSGLYQKYDDNISPIFKGRIIYPYLQNNEPKYFIGGATENTPDIIKNGEAKKAFEVSKYKKQLVYNSEKKPYVSKCVENILYGLDSLNKKDDKILITEGVTDAISLIQAGFKVISPITTKFNQKDNEKILNIIERKDEIYIINDAETNQEGKKGAIKTAKYLFKNLIKETYIVDLPKGSEEKVDINSYLNVFDIELHADKISSLIQYKEAIDPDQKLNDRMEDAHRKTGCVSVCDMLVIDIFNKITGGYDCEDSLTHFFDLIMFYDNIKKELFFTNLKRTLKGTGFDKGTLKQIDKLVNEEQQKKEFEDRKRLEKDFDEYRFEVHTFGTFLINERFDETRGKIKTELASFKSLIKEDKTFIDVYSGKNDRVENNINAIPLMNPTEPIDAINEKETSFLLESCKHSKSYTIKTEDISKFIEKFNNEDQIPTIKKKSVNIYCYQNKIYYSPDEYTCYSERQKIVNGERFKIRTNGFSCDRYKELMALEVDKDIVKQCVSDLNRIPINHEDAMVWKGILCKSISMMLKMELIHLGCKFFPIDVIMGEKGTGKSTLNQLLVVSLWNSMPRVNSELSGAQGARLDYPNDIRPIVYQELTEFKPNWIDMLKEGVTRGVFTIKKGTPDQGMNIKHFYQNYFIDTNEFSVEDPAFEQRICFWQKNVKLKDKNNIDIVNNLEANIKHLGKHLFNNFSNLDTKKLWDESLDYILKLNITGDFRKRTKYAQIRFGELVLKQVCPDLFNNVIFDYENVLGNKSYFVFNKKDEMVDQIKLLLSKVSLKSPNTTEVTLSHIIDMGSDLGVSYKQQLMDKYGLCVADSGDLCIIKSFLPILNSLRNKGKKFTSLKEVASVLEIKEKIAKYSIGTKKTTKYMINITHLLEDKEDE